MRILPVWSLQDPCFIYYLYIMARVKLSPIFTQVSGSIGGMTIQRNKFGVSLRQKPLPLNIGSVAQYNVRQLITSIQHAWQELTDAQRLQWNRYLDFSGQTIKRDKSVKLSGHALYIKYQLFRLLSGYALLTDITYVPMPAVPVIQEMTLELGVFQIEFSSAVDYSDYFFLLKLTTPRNENKAFSRRGLRFMKVTPADNQWFEIQTSYIAAFGVLPPVPHFVHYTIQWFSGLAPVFSGITTGVYEVTA